MIEPNYVLGGLFLDRLDFGLQLERSVGEKLKFFFVVLEPWLGIFLDSNSLRFLGLGPGLGVEG